jgi:hypothetical protein
MANDATGKVWTCDSVGMLTDQPVKVSKIIFYPNTAGHGVTFKYWDFGGATEKTTLSGVTATVSTNAITSTGNFVTANVAAGDGLRVKRTSTGNNVGNYYVVSRDSDNAVTVSFSTMTDEASKKYDMAVYAQKTACVLTSPGTEKAGVSIDFGGPDGTGQWFPSLGITSIGASGTAYVHIV